ncbi:MAG: PAS domain-containing protein, partial [Culicoidibacterales bacterium]
EIAWYKDTQLKYQYVNQTFVENTEKTAKEIIGKTSEEIWGELYPEIMNRSDHEILADHTSKKFPIFFPGLKHSTFLEINKTPIFRESGELIGIFGFAKNISNFKDLENELQTTLESLPMGASIHDLEGTLICFNDMYRFFCDRPIIIGENVYSSSFDYFNKALDFTREQDQVLIETGNPIVYETEILTDGQKRRIECTKTPILDFQNQVARILVLVRDVTEVFYQEQRMKELAFCDSLTQLANRRRLYESVKLAQESENYSCLFIADIINFKKFNAHFGYEFGNKILIACARRLKQQNFSALLSRDSDEFSIFMIFEKKPTAAMMSQYAQDIFNCLSKPIEVFDAYYTLDIKIGFSTAECNIPNFENIIHHSEYALKIAKDSDLQTIVEYDDHLVEQIRINEQLIMDFEQALHHNEIELFYQPQFTCQRKLVGFEALFRWPNNKFLQFNTEEIIRKIEKTSLIHKLGIYIFHKAFSFAENINKNRIEPLTVAINCSAYQIMSPDFVELIQ